MKPDPKQGERDYYARLGSEGLAHALRKPFSDDHCAHYLASMTAFFSLLPPPPARIVEFGCGTGWLSLALAQRGFDVLGLDISEDAVAHAGAAARNRELANVRFVAADYETFSGEGAFDFAIFHDSLHHAESELAALRCAHRALRDGGCVIALEPGSGHDTTPVSVRAVTEFGVHEKCMPPAHIVRVAREAGFRRHLVLPTPHTLNRLVYRRAYHQAPSRAELLGRWGLSLFRSLLHLSRSRWDPGLVMLWK